MDFSNYESMRQQGANTMQSRIRIIKRSEGAITNSVAADQSDRTDRQRERDTANTVKSWVAEWETRNRLVQAAAFSLLRSLENRSESSTRRFALVKG